MLTSRREELINPCSPTGRQSSNLELFRSRDWDVFYPKTLIVASTSSTGCEILISCCRVQLLPLITEYRFFNMMLQSDLCTSELSSTFKTSSALQASRSHDSSSNQRTARPAGCSFLQEPKVISSSASAGRERDGIRWRRSSTPSSPAWSNFFWRNSILLRTMKAGLSSNLFCVLIITTVCRRHGEEERKAEESVRQSVPRLWESSGIVLMMLQHRELSSLCWWMTQVTQNAFTSWNHLMMSWTGRQ